MKINRKRKSDNIFITKVDYKCYSLNVVCDNGNKRVQQGIDLGCIYVRNT